MSDVGIQLEMAVSFKRFVLEQFSGIVVSAYIYDVWLVDGADHPTV